MANRKRSAVLNRLAGKNLVFSGKFDYGTEDSLDARPEFNKTTAARCRKVGMDILSCTPEKLADAMAHIIRG
jgi:hypothetical protein